MGDPHGFQKLSRGKEAERAIDERIRDYKEFVIPGDLEELRAQASRCMDCGIPFCHQGCPLSNLIPEWNHLVYRGAMDEAAARLLETNNFPEITGRICPAPCEASCVLNLDGAPVTIKRIERTLGAHLFDRGPLVPLRAKRSGFSVAVVGSGPAGLAAAQELARKGHAVTVFERDNRVGGLLRYGIPDFKLEKGILDRRLDQLRDEGVIFETGVSVGTGRPLDDLLNGYDGVLLATGARIARDLSIEGRSLTGVHYAMDYLVEQNRRVAGDPIPETIYARGKHVVVIGGGDTGSDCVGTAVRQGATSVTQFELMPKPPLARMPENPWPEWPLVLRTSSSHEEGAMRDWAVSTRAVRGANGRVTELEAVRVRRAGSGFEEISGSTFSIPCDLVLLAMGFTGAEPSSLTPLNVAFDNRGNVRSDGTGATSVPGLFAAGDVSRGQSLVVWAIADGRRVAQAMDAYLYSNARVKAANE